MAVLNLNTQQENKKKILFVNYTNTKRLQWDNHRRYGF